MPPLLLPYNRAPRANTQRYRIAQPWETHYGPVSCKDYDCEQYLAGWGLVLPFDSDQIAFIRSLKDKQVEVAPGQWHRYTFTEERSEPLLITFRFPAGQPCFKASTHRWHVRPPIFAHDKNEQRRVLRSADFMDSFNTEAYRINHERQKG